MSYHALRTLKSDPLKRPSLTTPTLGLGLHNSGMT